MRTLLFGVLTSAIAFAPGTRTTQPATTVLSGRVMVAAGAEQRPVRRAKVTLSGRGLTGPRIADTDAKGAFRFDRLAPGDYRIAVEKPGFVKLETELQPGATLTMVRGAAIEGVVTDSAGDPVWNVAVTALEAAGEGAKPKIVAQVRTDLGFQSCRPPAQKSGEEHMSSSWACRQARAYPGLLRCGISPRPID
jgi:hypothetical protein